jgi:hypothetical protein
MTFGTQASPCFLPSGSVASSLSRKLLFKRGRWAELSARFIYSWHSQRQFRWSRKCHPVPASLPYRPPGRMTGRPGSGEETPPQVAQMTNRFPHFLVYPVPALIWALLLFCPPLGLLASEPVPCPARGKIPTAPYRSMSSSTNSGGRARQWEGTLSSIWSSQEGSQELCPGHKVWAHNTKQLRP